MGLQAAGSLRRVRSVVTLVFLIVTTTLAAYSANADQPKFGPVTNLPLPRFVSLKTSEGNARRGPSLNHRIDWVFKRRSMPLQVTAEHGHWRRVSDQDGVGGWIHYSLLSGVRTVLVVQDETRLYSKPSDDTLVVAKAEAGVVARLGECNVSWCRITAGGERGWVQKTLLWGVSPNELRE